MSVIVRGIAHALCAMAWFPSSALAQDPTPSPPDEPPPAEEPPAPEPAPEAPPAPASSLPAEPAPAALTPEELKQLEAALQSDTAASAAQPAGVPDLSKVNLGAALPQQLQSLNPDMSVILDTAGAWFSVNEPLQTGAHDPRLTGFTLQQVEMSIGASVDPFFRFDSALVFSLEEGVDVEEAYATTLALPFGLQGRAGRFFHRFGRIIPTHPHSWSFVDQPIALGKIFGDEGSRGSGVELSWLLPLPWFTEAVVELTNADELRSFLGEDPKFIETPLDLLVDANVSQFFPVTDDFSVLLGFSAQTGPNSSAPGRRSEIYGTDLMLRLRPLDSDTRWSLTLQTEALIRGRETPAGKLWDGGGYTQLVWLMDPQWESGARYELVSGVVGDPLDPDWSTWRQRGTVQLTHYPSHFSRIRVQASVDHPAWLPGTPIFAVIAQLEVLIGVHAAHAY